MPAGHPALADDSGLWVDALDGAAGHLFGALGRARPRISRIAMARVEQELRERDATDFSAKFVCALSLAMPHGEMQTFEGEVHGHLTFPPRGDHGFGYDPIFIAEGMDADLRRNGSARETRHEPPRPGLREAAAQRHLRGIALDVAFGIYVHWPFCAAKCPYCDFNSHVRTAIDEDGWVEAIERELDWTAQAQGDDRPMVETIFFGGGTPSLMQGQSVGARAGQDRRALAAWPMMSKSRWKPIPPAPMRRASPITAPPASTALSLGVQALNDADLKTLGRLHDAAEAKAALALAMSNFDRVSLDLIYARPDQSDAQWRAELKQALAFGTDHLSLYQLTIEPETPFALLHKTGAAANSRRRSGGRTLRDDAGTDRSRGPARLRNFQSCPARRGKPPQSDLLALWRLCRRRSRRAWPADAGRQAHRHRRHPAAGTLARRGGEERPRLCRSCRQSAMAMRRANIC